MLLKHEALFLPFIFRLNQTHLFTNPPLCNTSKSVKKEKGTFADKRIQCNKYELFCYFYISYGFESVVSCQ